MTLYKGVIISLFLKEGIVLLNSINEFINFYLFKIFYED